MTNKTQLAVRTLVAALLSDTELYFAYQSNIAMAIFDTYNKEHGGYFDARPTQPEMHKICNDGAKRFLDLLCREMPDNTDDTTFLEKLTELQSKIGYVAGHIHPVAFLGLLGEAGEVAAEAKFNTSELTPFDKNDQTGYQARFLNEKLVQYSHLAEKVDSLKKIIRNEKNPYLCIVVSDGELFNKELADQFYYLKAVAANQGLTIEDLARISYEKVVARRGEVKQGDPAK
ncbi:hypothetical protein GCM10028808_73450 [Spirosoma migulaei]